jgi:hypothetical protein
VAFGAHVGGFLCGFAAIGIVKLLGRRLEKKERSVLFETALVPAVAPADTFTGETPTIYLHDGVVQSGPFTLSQIQAALAGGGIVGNALYWSEGMAEWQNVSDLVAGPLQ